MAASLACQGLVRLCPLLAGCRLAALSDQLRKADERQIGIAYGSRPIVVFRLCSRACQSDIIMCRSHICGISRTGRGICRSFARTIPPGPSGSVQNQQGSSAIIIRSSTMTVLATTIGSRRSSAKSRPTGRRSSPRSPTAKRCFGGAAIHHLPHLMRVRSRRSAILPSASCHRCTPGAAPARGGAATATRRFPDLMDRSGHDRSAKVARDDGAGAG